jgi:hypothetical protein
MGGDGALAHAKDFLQFRYGQLLGLQEQQNAQPV